MLFLSASPFYVKKGFLCPCQNSYCNELIQINFQKLLMKITLAKCKQCYINIEMYAKCMQTCLHFESCAYDVVGVWL